LNSLYINGQKSNVETSFAATGRYVETDGIEIGTYPTVLRENGVLYGEGQGVITTTDERGR
jgi:hypothetical protein